MIHDSYLSNNDEELFLVETSRTPLKWLAKYQIKKDIYDNYIDLKKKERALLYSKLYNLSCNTDKTAVSTCDIKCKSRGVILFASNCGVTVSFREIFGAESLPQVAMLLMDTLELYQGKFIIKILLF